MKHLIMDMVSDSVAVKEAFAAAQADRVVDCAERLAQVLAAGGKILICGNGGSAADAQHIAAEFVNRFRVERPPLGALALTTDSSVLTSIGNDYDFSQIFEKQVRALGRRGDALIGISTSGGSPNVIRAMEAAREMDLLTIGFSGGISRRGGRLAELADICFTIPSDVTARIQETHILLGHLLCELVDRILYPDRFPAA